MVEIVTIGIHPIVTGQAVKPEIRRMRLHEFKISPVVTRNADSLIVFGIVLSMAIVATEERTISFKCMTGQQKAKFNMREGYITQVCQRWVWTAMVGVAVAAVKAGIVVAQHAVQSGWILPLGSHVGVTDHTLVSHGGIAPKWGVAQAALTSNIRMRTHPAQRCTCLGTKRSRAEQHAALYESESGHDQGS